MLAKENIGNFCHLTSLPFQTMLNLINDRLNRKVFDDVMEVAWSTMWNVTDETSVNCERFLDGKGMEYFLGCLRVSPVSSRDLPPFTLSLSLSSASPTKTNFSAT